MPSRTLGSWLGVWSLGALLSVTVTTASAEPEKAQELPAVVVAENPFGRVGFGAVAFFGLFSRMTGGAPYTPWVIFAVIAGSPADRAGLVVGDEITAINGIPFSQLPTRKLGDLLDKSDSGSEIQVDLRDGRTKTVRQIMLRTDSGKEWFSKERRTNVIWGLLVTTDDARTLKIGLNMSPYRGKLTWKEPRVCTLSLGDVKFHFVEGKQGEIKVTVAGRDLGIFTRGDRIRIRPDGTLSKE
ncbi:MAG TPA: PDZ domain-containing protein [Bryobacteraceae bacterium]|nr:PDZ domain-containing protein [Bryobacteraceae bacterium]